MQAPPPPPPSPQHAQPPPPLPPPQQPPPPPRSSATKATNGGTPASAAKPKPGGSHGSGSRGGAGSSGGHSSSGGKRRREAQQHVRAKLEEQKQKQAAQQRHLSRWRERVQSDFQVDLQFQLPLPEVPLGPRFLRVDPLASLGALVEYRDALPLATRFRYDCAGDVTMGITGVDTVDSRKWHPPTVEAGPGSAAGGRRPALHPDDAAILEWDRFVQGQGRHVDEEGEEDPGATAAAAAADAPWMLRPLYEVAVTYEKTAVKQEDGGEGGRARGEEAGAGEEDGAEEGTLDGWRRAVERTFVEAAAVGASGAAELEAPVEGMAPVWVAPVVPNLSQWASDLVVCHFGNELRGREEEAAQEAPLFLLEEQGELEHGATRRAGYHRGPRQDETATGVGGLYSEEFAPARYYDLVVERVGPAAGVAEDAAAASSGQQHLLLMVEPGGGVSMCPTLGNVRLKKPSRAMGAKPAKGVRLRHRPLAEEEKERRELKLINAGIDDEAAAAGRLEG